MQGARIQSLLRELRSHMLQLKILHATKKIKGPKHFCFSGGAVHAQGLLTLCDPMDCGPPDSSVHGFPRKEYWSEMPFPSLEDLPEAGIEPRSPALQADS